jgi:16S rRNA (adenine1518-N6/adenine1519-N6)-dimethyltransferase
LAKEERVDLVDNRDSVVGSATLTRCLNEGLLHRAVAVILNRNSEKILLQKRSKRKRWHPGMWTLSSTGHVRAGESYQTAAVRELNEELGIRTELIFVRKFFLAPFRDGERTEHEWVALFEGWTDAHAKIDLAELESVGEFTRKQARRMGGEGRLTPDAVMLLTNYLRLEPRSV